MARIYQIPCGWSFAPGSVVAPFSGNIITADQVFGEALLPIKI